MGNEDAGVLSQIAGGSATIENARESTSADSFASSGRRFEFEAGKLAGEALGSFLLGFDSLVRLRGRRLLAATRLRQESDQG